MKFNVIYVVHLMVFAQWSTASELSVPIPELLRAARLCLAAYELKDEVGKTEEYLRDLELIGPDEHVALLGYRHDDKQVGSVVIKSIMGEYTVVISGTDSVGDAVANLAAFNLVLAPKSTTQPGEDNTIDGHAGYTVMGEDFMHTFRQLILQSSPASRSVNIYGHSLGGALAVQLTFGLFQIPGISIETLTFGAAGYIESQDLDEAWQIFQDAGNVQLVHLCREDDLAKNFGAFVGYRNPGTFVILEDIPGAGVLENHAIKNYIKTLEASEQSGKLDGLLEIKISSESDNMYSPELVGVSVGLVMVIITIFWLVTSTK